MTALKLFLLSLILSLIHASTQAQNTRQSDLYFSIYFGGGFERDSLSLSINSVEVFSNHHLHSVPNLGLAGGGVKIIRDGKKLYVLNSDDKVSKTCDKTPEEVSFKFIFRGKEHVFDVQDEKGRYLIFSCGVNGEIVLEQLEKEPAFM